MSRTRSPEHDQRSPFEPMLPTSRPTLRIISWGHRRGPLQPPPHIVIDLRKLPNPPKQSRDIEHNYISKALREWLFSNSIVQQRFQDACLEIRKRLREAKESGCQDVTVGVNCELGRHRSVAFVEELGRVKWDGWETVVCHRDLNAPRSHGVK